MGELRDCPDCGANPGSAHGDNCDVMRCSSCGIQRLSCDCDGIHDPSLALWTGLWPGVAECRERGWYCQDGHGADSRYGGFCPCDKNDPGATEDLNRWFAYVARGKDVLYDGCTRVPRRVTEDHRKMATATWSRTAVSGTPVEDIARAIAEAEHRGYVNGGYLGVYHEKL